MGGLFTAILFSLVGVAYLWTGVTARKGLKMTSFYAVRTEHTRKTPEIFAAANRAVWGLFIVNGAIAVIACGLVLVFKAYRVEGFANTFVAIAVIAGVFTV
ncbi:MAG: hypothetical protein Q4C71_06375, partial [Microbacteriaceae bacterium]|nr:hypothetical protein [Microbacteriaceae bacterium]